MAAVITAGPITVAVANITEAAETMVVVITMVAVGIIPITTTTTTITIITMMAETFGQVPLLAAWSGTASPTVMTRVTM
jgi:hypothetical protein